MSEIEVGEWLPFMELFSPGKQCQAQNSTLLRIFRVGKFSLEFEEDTFFARRITRKTKSRRVPIA